MKKILALLALVLGVVSCQTEPEGLDVNVGGEVETTVCVSLPEATRANSALGAFENVNLADEGLTIRYILKIYQHTTANGVETWTPSNDLQVRYTQDKDETIVFPVRLVPNRDYNFVVWADLVEKTNDQDDDYYKADDDVHYNTSNLANITLKGDWNAMDETRDAYTGFHNTKEKGTQYSSSLPINITLTRPFAKLRVITTDMEALANLDLEPEKAVAKYSTNHYNAFNACSGQPFDKTIEYKEHTIADVKTYGEAGTLFVDYFFATQTQESVQFELTVYDQYGDAEVNKIKYNNFSTEIAVQRNYLTTISGNILTDGNNVEVTVEDTFANYDNDGNLTNPDYEYATISSAAEFLAALNSPGEFIVISDLEIANVGDTVSNGQVNRLATRSGSTTIVDLNGHTITVKNTGTEALATVASNNTLVITDTTGEGKIELSEGSNGAFIENNGVVVIESGELDSNSTYSAPVIKNNGTTNVKGGVINEGAIENNNEGTTNITGGTINDDLANLVPDGYDATKNDDGSFTVTESEPVAKIGDKVYTTLQAAFDAADGETTIVLLRDATFKNTTVLAEGKTVILDLGGKTLAVADKNAIKNDGGNLTIKNGTITRTGDVVGYSVNNASGEITIENATITRGLYTSGSKMTATNANISHEQSSRHAIYAWNCEVAINGGTYHNDNAGNATLMASGSSVVTINGGTFSIADGRPTLTWTSCMIDQNSTAQVIIKDGQFNGGFRINSADTVLTIEGGKFNTNNGSGYTYNNGTVSIKGGTYTDAAAKAFAEKYIAEGYVVVENEGKYTVTELVLNATFAQNDWSDIVLACENNCVPESWNVGDTKAMTIAGKDYQIRILGKNHDTYTAGGKAPLTFQIAEVYGSAAMNATQTNTTGWSGSQMRTETMAEILKVMPVKDAIKAVNKETLNGTRDGLETTSDKLFLLSEIEVNGSVYFSNNFAEGSRYAFFGDVDSMKLNATYWLRGPGKTNAIGYTQINMSGYMANGSAEYAAGVVFGFCF